MYYTHCLSCLLSVCEYLQANELIIKLIKNKYSIIVHIQCIHVLCFKNKKLLHIKVKFSFQLSQIVDHLSPSGGNYH